MTPDVQDTAFPADAIEVGRIADAWGIKGWFKVQSYSATADALFASRRWFLQPAEDAKKPLVAVKVAVKAQSLPPLLKILACRDHGDTIVANAEGVADRNSAEALRGARIFISRSLFPSADPDEYYWIDLIGLSVVNREGEQLGTVLGLMDAGPHSVLRIAPVGAVEPLKPEQERLIPFVGAIVDDVSLEKKLITVDWGLDY